MSGRVLSISVERAPGVSIEEIVEATAGALVVPEDVPEMLL